MASDFMKIQGNRSRGHVVVLGESKHSILWFQPLTELT
jgi:hypothetical protein